MLLTDRNFNTSFYDPALRHSSVEHPIIFLLGDAVYHSILQIEKASGLFDGADSNELPFLGSMNSVMTVIIHRQSAFLKSNFNTRSAKAKIHFKTDSTYEALYLYQRYRYNWTNQTNLCDIKGKIHYCWNGSGKLPVALPEQNQS